MTRVNGQLVVPRDDGWAVMPEDGKRASRVFESKLNAIRYAHRVAERNHVHLVIYNKDGSYSKFMKCQFPSLATDPAGII